MATELRYVNRNGVQVLQKYNEELAQWVDVPTVDENPDVSGV